MTTLTEGRWFIRTAASSYVIDIDELWLQRNPGDGGALDDPYYTVSSLRGDGTRLPLVVPEEDEGIEVAIGVSSIFYLDDSTRYRITTPVVSFAQVERAVEAA